MQKKSQRQLQIGEQIKRIVADTFARENFSTISGNFITILEADVSPDIKNCVIFINIFGNEKKNDEILQKLNGAAGFFRREIGKKITFRNNPEIVFKLDRSAKNAVDIEDLIHKESQKFPKE